MNFFHVLTVVLLLSPLLLAQNVRVSDYNVPVSQATTVRAEGNWNFSQIGDSVASNNATGLLIFRKFYTSLPTAFTIDIDASGRKSFKDYTYTTNLDVTYKKYVWETRNWFGSTNFSASRNFVFSPIIRDTTQVASDLTLGIGFGRYIKTTPLAKAVRIEDHLIRERIIGDFMPKATMINIANIIEREEEYKAIYREIYENVWTRDIENEIQKTEMLEDESIGALGFQRMRQVLFGLNERVNERFYGWDVTAGLLFVLTNADKSPVGHPNFSLVGQYSLPISWSIQMNSKAQVFTPLDKLAFKDYQSKVQVDFIFEMSNRINLLSQYIFNYQKREKLSGIYQHDLITSFLYYVENSIYLTYTINYNKVKGNPLRFTSNLGVQYNLF